jgi:hypothetical protein
MKFEVIYYEPKIFIPYENLRWDVIIPPSLPATKLGGGGGFIMDKPFIPP